DRPTQLVSPDGTSTYSYDVTNQLTAVGGVTNEAYSYDANGNRTMTNWTTGTANRLTGDPLYTYTYDAEGNRTQRTLRAGGEVVDYSWAHRQRLTEVATRATPGGTITKDVIYSYDAFGRRVGKSVDNDGAGPGEAQVTRFSYDGDDLALAYTGTGAGA